MDATDTTISVVNPHGETAIGYAETWLDSLGATTRRAYAQAMGRFANHIKADARQTWAFVLCAESWRLNQAVLDWVAHNRERLTPATINQTLSAISSVLKVARAAGLTRNELAVRRPKVVAYRDTTGPTIKSLGLMIQAAKAQKVPWAQRDLLLLLLGSTMALRRGEMESLRIDSVQGDKLQVLGKGQQMQRTPCTMPRQVMVACQEWLDARARHLGDRDTTDRLFVALDANHLGCPLTARSIERVISGLAEKAGVGKVAPHALRHAAITAVLDETDGDVRSTRSFSRHSSVESVLIYDDRRADTGGKLAQILADRIELAEAV